MMALLFSSVALAERETVHDRLLVKAIHSNDLMQAEKMLKRGANLKHYRSNLWIQKEKPSVEMINLFHKYNTPMFSNRHLKNNCLLKDLITSRANEELFIKVKALVDNNIDIHCYNLTDSNLIYSLVLKLRHNIYGPRMKSIEYILQKGAKKDLNTFVAKWSPSGMVSLRKPFHNARSEEMMKLLIKYGTKINEPTSKKTQSRHSYGGYLIHRIAHAGYTDLLKTIGPQIDNINVLDSRKYTILDIAHADKNDALELFLLDKGAKYAKHHVLNAPDPALEKSGIVEVNHTGLIWKRCSQGQGWTGSTCTGDTAYYTWKSAMNHAENHSYANYNDWRLPTVKELNTLVHCSNGNQIQYIEDGYKAHHGGKPCKKSPTINQQLFPNTVNHFYWTSSLYADKSWVVNFGSGYDKLTEKKSFGHHFSRKVRLVRRNN